MEDDRWFVGMWVLASVGDEGKAISKVTWFTEMVLQKRRQKRDKEEREEIRHEWMMCR